MRAGLINRSRLKDSVSSLNLRVKPERFLDPSQACKSTVKSGLGSILLETTSVESLKLHLRMDLFSGRWEIGRAVRG